jgi:CheY-like chemotaxis protein
VRILTDRGAQCVAADGVEQALQLLQASHLDILLSDIGMPGRDGYDLIRAARQLDRQRETPLPAVAITAYVHCSLATTRT